MLGLIVINQLLVLPLAEVMLGDGEHSGSGSSSDGGGSSGSNSTSTGDDLELDSSAFYDWLGVEVVFSFVYVVEAMLKLCILGLHRYFISSRHRFDFVVTVVPLAAELALLASPQHALKSAELVRGVLLLQMLRMLRIFTAVRRFRVIFRTFIRLLPSAASLLGVLGMIGLVFGLLGVALFGGKMYPGAPALVGSVFEREQYGSINFNDMASAMLTLWCLLLVNDWWVLMEAAVAVTGGCRLNRCPKSVLR